MWRTIRIIALTTAFLAAIAIGDEERGLASGFTEAGILAALIFAVSVVWGPLVCFMQHLMQSFASDFRGWSCPSFTISPFAARKPLQFWYFSSFVFLCIGSGFLIHSLLFREIAPNHMLFYFAGPIGMLIGCRLALRLFHSRFSTEPTQAEQADAGNRRSAGA